MRDKQSVDINEVWKIKESDAQEQSHLEVRVQTAFAGRKSTRAGYLTTALTLS